MCTCSLCVTEHGRAALLLHVDCMASETHRKSGAACLLALRVGKRSVGLQNLCMAEPESWPHGEFTCGFESASVAHSVLIEVSISGSKKAL